MQQLNTEIYPIRASKDYIFDVERFTSFEGNTGPYILYTIVRIKSILEKYMQEGKNPNEGTILEAVNDSEKNLMLELSKFNSVIAPAFEEKAPHKICSYIYDLAKHLTAFIMKLKFLANLMKNRRNPGFVC